MASCFLCGLPDTELRPVNGSHKLCSLCRWKQEHKCLVKGCKTPSSKVKLKNFPGRLVQATEAVRAQILSQFGIPPELKQCCKACFLKLHRATAEFATNNLTPAKTTTTTTHEEQNKKGRPTVTYKEASTKTKKRIERKAMDLLNNTISHFKDSCNEISGGCGEKLVDVTFQAANLPRRSAVTADEIKADSNIIQGLSTAYANTKSTKERVQILSSVAPHFDNKTLRENFNYVKDGQKISCTSYEITQARLHYSQYGAAATASKEQETTAMRTSQEQLAFLVEFLHSPECTERSSYKTADCSGKRRSWLSDILGGGTQPVLHLKHNKEQLFSMYREKCEEMGETPIGRTLFYNGLVAANFHQLEEMAGLCNICTESGAENFENLHKLAERIELHWLQNNEGECPISDLKERAKNFKGYLLGDFSNNLKNHDECASHCMEWCLSDEPQCGNNHSNSCSNCNERWQLIDDICSTVDKLNCSSEERDTLKTEVAVIEDNMSKYISHLIRGKYQRDCYMKEIADLKPGHAIGVSDYMMKLMFRRLYEPQKDWFGKKGASVHGVMFLYREVEEGPILTEYHDTFSESDDTQNWFFSASCLEESVKNLKALHPEIKSFSLWSDNGPHYKNSSLIIWLQKLDELTGIQLKRFSNFEAQKGKTKLDSHYATLKFALRQHMKEGNSVLCGEDIVDGTRGRLRGTHVYPIEINRDAEPPSAKTLAGISQYGDFEYTTDGIVMRENTGLGQGKLYNNDTLKKLSHNCSLTTTKASTGFDIDNAKNVPKLGPKVSKEKAKNAELKTSKKSQENQDLLCKCDNCGKKFLRPGNLQRHKESKTCTSKKEKSENIQCVPHESDSSAMKTTLSKIKEQSFKKQPKQISEQKQEAFALELKGSAQRRVANKRKATRFTDEQKEIMDRCFDSGAKRKSARYTPAQCQKEMGRHIGVDNVLKEAQIRAYFSRRHAKLLKEE